MSDNLIIDKNFIERRLRHAKKRLASSEAKLKKREESEIFEKCTLTKYAYFDFLYWDFKVDMFESLLEGDYDPENVRKLGIKSTKEDK